MITYRVKETSVGAVSFKLETEAKTGTLRSNQACYYLVTQTGIDPKYKSLLIVEESQFVPYTEESVTRWLNDLNEIGFPCHFVSMDDKLQIRLMFEDFQNKLHFASTLFLVRLLFETGMTIIPEKYFQAMDENPDGDKLDAIQAAHKFKNEQHDGYFRYFNSNHTVTSGGNGEENVTKEELFKRFSKGPAVYGSHTGPLGVSRTWCAAPFKEGERYYDG